MIQIVSTNPKELCDCFVIEPCALESCFSFADSYQYVKGFNSVIRLLSITECDSTRQISESGFQDLLHKVSKPALLISLPASQRLLMSGLRC